MTGLWLIIVWFEFSSQIIFYQSDDSEKRRQSGEFQFHSDSSWPWGVRSLSIIRDRYIYHGWLVGVVLPAQGRQRLAFFVIIFAPKESNLVLGVFEDIADVGGYRRCRFVWSIFFILCTTSWPIPRSKGRKPWGLIVFRTPVLARPVSITRNQQWLRFVRASMTFRFCNFFRRAYMPQPFHSKS